MKTNEPKDICYIVIPAYNEAAVIKSVMKDIHKTEYKNIIVVDDGSNDNTYKQAQMAGAIVVRHIINRGKGAAVKTGIEAAKLIGATQVVTIDADGQHDPEDINKMVKLFDLGYDVILGTREFHYKNIPIFRLMGNYFGNFFTWLLYGIWVNDSQSGFRAYSKRALASIDTRHDRYEFDSEIIREISRHHLKYCEVPITVFYTKHSMQKHNKQSFVNGIKTVVRMIIAD